MSIEELREEKRTLESKIENLINDFRIITGVQVEEVMVFNFEGDLNITVKAIIQ